MSEDSMGLAMAFVFSMGILIGGTVGGCCGDKNGESRVRQEAIKAKVGYWHVNEETGETCFVFDRGKR